jgi:hypothetical protein
MIEFENLVYLDIQKTGSTYVVAFLRTFVASSEIRTIRHAPVEKRTDGKLYVISCRDPLSQYRSLYGYGCKGKGILRNRLRAAGKSHLYDGSQAGFIEWLYLVLTPEACRIYAAERETDPMYDIAGLQTVRFMRMALPLNKAIRSYRRSGEELKAKLRRKLDKCSLADIVLRQETLNSDLAALVVDHPKIFRNVDEIPEFLSRSRKVNASPDMKVDSTALPISLLELLQEREWLYFDKLGYRKYV